MELLKNFLLQLFFAVGLIVIFGLLIALCRRAFCRIVGPAGPKILLATGIVGTPIHELSHALMCLIFGHKIVEIKLFDPKAKSGALGYVNHTFNSKNIYHQIGNFFIGIAPIVCGSGVLLLLSLLLVPNVNSDIIQEFRFTDSVNFSDFFKSFGNILGSVFKFENMSNLLWWIFIILAFSIASHMELSGADVKGSVLGFLILSGLLLVADTIIYFISLDALETVTGALASFSLSISVFLALSLTFLLAMLLIALIVKGIACIFKR